MNTDVHYGKRKQVCVFERSELPKNYMKYRDIKDKIYMRFKSTKLLQEEYERIYTARTKAKSAAKRAGKFARSAASKSAREAIEVDSESTEDTIIARKEIVKAADARALAETAAKANAAEEKAITVEQSAGKATTVEATQAAAAEAVIEASKVKTWKTEVTINFNTDLIFPLNYCFKNGS